MLSIHDVIEIIDKKHLNCKTNNYIFYGFNSETLYSVVNYSRSRKPIIENYDEIKYEIDAVDSKLHNILIDLSDIEIENLFNECLMQIGINEKLPFKDAIDAYKFKRILSKNKKMLQLIFYNGEELSESKQRLLNEILWINTYLFNIIYLLKDTRYLPTFQTTKGYILDDRENYDKYEVRNI